MGITRDNLTVIIVTLKSEKIIHNCLDSIGPDIKKIIIENSNNQKFTESLKKKYKNIECFTTGKNLGMGTGNNFGIKKSTTKYAMILNPDTILKEKCIDEIINNSKDINFTILSPLNEDKRYPNYKIFNQKKINDNLFEVDRVDGYAMILDISKFDNNFFDEKIFNLMDFDCEQRESVHFFYTLPYSKNKALIETTWLSKMNDNSQKDYDNQIKEYIEKNLKIKNYEITYKEEGAIPLFYPLYKREGNKLNIGTAGGMTRLSTGYTFLNIQEHSKYLRENIENISNSKRFEISKKYQFLDEIFLRVLEKHPEKMSDIFFKMFKTSPKTVIKFLSNKSNMFEDFNIIFKMPKWIFIKALFY